MFGPIVLDLLNKNANAVSRLASVYDYKSDFKYASVHHLFFCTRSRRCASDRICQKKKKKIIPTSLLAPSAAVLSMSRVPFSAFPRFDGRRDNNITRVVVAFLTMS